jgi:hypothetical protein
MDYKFVALDCEAGGIGLDKSLLVVYLLFLPEDLDISKSVGMELRLKHDAYVVTPEGMAINGIDLVEHHKTASYKSELGQQLVKDLRYYSNEGRTKLVPIGHGVFRDLWWIWEQLVGRKTFEQYVSYRKLDTAVIAQFQQIQGKLPKFVSGSLESLVEYYGIQPGGPLHDAKVDTIATVLVLKKQLKQ